MGLIFSYLANATTTTPRCVGGLSFVHTWKSIEPTKGTYDWSQIDADIAWAEQTGKQVALHLLWGYNPPWLAAECPTVSIAWQPPFGKAQVTVMAIPWTLSYLERVGAVIAAYGARYEGNPRVSHIAMAGAGWQDDFQLPHPSPVWMSAAPPPAGCGPDVYTDAKLIAAWNFLIDAYVAAFPKTPKTMPYNTSGLSADDWAVTNAVAEHAIGREVGVILQENGLQASTATQKVRQLAALATSHGAGGYGLQQAQAGSTPADIEAQFAIAVSASPKPLFVEVYAADASSSANYGALQVLAKALQ